MSGTDLDVDTMLDITVEGFSGAVHVRVQGPVDAPVVLELHGFSGSMHWWGRTVPDLARDHRVLRTDLLGHGATGGGAADAPLQAAVVDAVLTHLDVHDVTAVGHSFGADVAVELAERSPRVGRLVIVCQAPDYSDARLPVGRELMTMRRLAPHLHRSAVLAARTAASVRNRARPHAANRAVIEQAVRDLTALDTAMFRVVLVDRRDRMARRPLDAQVRDAGKPTLVLLGGRDHFYGARSAGRYRAAGAHVVVLPTSDHSPMMQMPDRVVQLLREFVPVTPRRPPE